MPSVIIQKYYIDYNCNYVADAKMEMITIISLIIMLTMKTTITMVR